MARLISPQRGVLAVVVAMAAVVLFPTASAPAKKKSCARSGDVLIAATSHVRVVRRRLARRDGMTRHEWAACWKPTGRRSRLDVEEDFGADIITEVRVELVDDRFVGVVTDEYILRDEIHRAAIYDTKTGRRLHTTRACGASATDDDFVGIYDVVFLARGGLAFTCDRLLLFRRASSRTAEVIEPPGTNVWDLAASRQVLFWRLETEDREVITKSLALF